MDNEVGTYDVSCFFFFNDTATTEIYTLSLHDALPISSPPSRAASSTQRRSPRCRRSGSPAVPEPYRHGSGRDRKSTRLNSSHANISYAVFCLKKKKNHYSSQILCPKSTNTFHQSRSCL